MGGRTGLAFLLPFFARFFFFPLFSSSPGRRMPIVFLGRSITWPMEALTV
jgi:hypothetical protein